MNFLEKIAKALGLEDATEEQVLEALAARPSLADIAKALDIEAECADAEALVAAVKEKHSKPEEKSLEDRAKDEGKVVVTAAEVIDLKAKADRGAAAMDELHQGKFDAAFEKALDEVRVDAKDETRERYQKLYDAAPELTLEQLDNLPKLAPTASRGTGKGGGEAAPAGVDAERHALDQKVRAYMKEHADVTYVQALDILADQEVSV